MESGGRGLETKRYEIKSRSREQIFRLFFAVLELI